MSFTIRCNNCNTEVDITRENVADFIHVFAWGNNNFKVYDDMLIGAFVTYDMSNETVLCKCGHVV